jgi:hypothetical protein
MTIHKIGTKKNHHKTRIRTITETTRAYLLVLGTKPAKSEDLDNSASSQGSPVANLKTLSKLHQKGTEHVRIHRNLTLSLKLK